MGTALAAAAPLGLWVGAAGAAAPLSKSQFTRQVGTVFAFSGEGSAAEARLAAVTDGPRASQRGECYALHFEGGGDLPQATYRVAHRALGRFDLFVVPAGQGPIAIFNTM